MAGKKREKVRDEDVTGLKYFDKLQPLLKRLHEVGCQRRWTIEIFVRFFKQTLGCRSLLSHDPVGIEIQAYCAIIAHIDSLVDGPQTDAANVRDDLLLLHGLGRGGQTAGALGQTTALSRLIQTRCHLLGRRGVRCCAPLALCHHAPLMLPSPSAAPDHQRRAHLPANSSCATIEPNRIETHLLLNRRFDYFTNSRPSPPPSHTSGRRRCCGGFPAATRARRWPQGVG